MLNEIHAILDWETLSTEHYALPLAYGLSIFSLKNGIIHTEGANIHRASVPERCHISPITVDWWMNQPREVYKPFQRTVPLVHALKEIQSLLDHYSVDRLWGHGKEFDISLLWDYISLYEDIDIEDLPAAKFYNAMDTRTLFAMFPEIRRIWPEQSHNPMVDAEAEAETILACFKRMKELRDGV